MSLHVIDSRMSCNLIFIVAWPLLVSFFIILIGSKLITLLIIFQSFGHSKKDHLKNPAARGGVRMITHPLEAFRLICRTAVERSRAVRHIRWDMLA